MYEGQQYSELIDCWPFKKIPPTWKCKLDAVGFYLDAVGFYFYSSIIQTINLIHLQNAKDVTQPRSQVGVFSSCTGEPSFLPTVAMLQAMISIIVDIFFCGFELWFFLFLFHFLNSPGL